MRTFSIAPADSRTMEVPPLRSFYWHLGCVGRRISLKNPHRRAPSVVCTWAVWAKWVVVQALMSNFAVTKMQVARVLGCCLDSDWLRRSSATIKSPNNASLNPLCASKLDLELIDISWFERFIVANIEDAPQLSLDQIFSRREGPCVCKEDSAGGDMPAAAAMHSPHISSNPWALWRDIKRHTPSGAIPSSPRPSRVVKNVSPTPESGSSVLSARSILKKRETLKQVLGNVSSPLPLEAWVTGVKMTAAPEATEKSILLDSPREKNWKIFLRVSSGKSVLPRLILGPKQLFFFLQARLARKAFYLATFFSI